MKRFLIPIFVAFAACSSPDEPKVGTDSGTSAEDVGSSEDTGARDSSQSENNSAADASSGDMPSHDAGAPDAAEDMLSMDTGLLDSGSADMSFDMPSADASGNDLGMDMSGADSGTDMGPANCVYGAGGGGVDGSGNLFCEQTVDCDGTAYKVDCASGTCTCFIDGVEGSTLATDEGEFCSRFVLRDCGAPIPPVNPICYETDISFGDGGDFCERSVTCNDIGYTFECDLPGGPCRCIVGDTETTVAGATDCSNYVTRLTIDCGAPIQP